VKPENLPQADLNAQGNSFILFSHITAYFCIGLFDLAQSLPKESSQEFRSALEDKANATRTLVSSFVHFSQQSPSKSDDNRWYEAQRATTEVRLHCVSYRQI
jgi:hypothetical protein